MTNHEKERWVELYKSAVLELEQSLLEGRIADARAEIVKRVEALRDIPGLHHAEQQAIQDALNVLRVLEREGAKHAAEHQSKLAADALEKLRSIEPKIGRRAMDPSD